MSDKRVVKIFKTFKKTSAKRVGTRLSSPAGRLSSGSKRVVSSGKISKKSSSKGKTCPRGYTTRAAYTRTTGSGKIKVSEGCIVKRGKGGPKVIPKLTKGTLTRYGYHSKDIASVRREALDRAVNDWNYGGVVHKLNAIRVLQKNTNPVLSNKFHSDMLWLKKKYR